MGHQCEMFVIDIRNVDTVFSQDDAITRIAVNGPRISAILWGAMDETIITGHEDGEITLWDVRVSKKFAITIFNICYFIYIYIIDR